MEYLKELETKLTPILGAFKEEVLGLRINRPTPKLLENIKVEYGDDILSVKQLGSIGVELPKSLTVTVWDKNLTALVARGIEAANIGVSVSYDGNLIRITLPELTQERREELVKLVKSLAEKTRIKMRTLRDEINKKVNSEPDKDIKFKAKAELQKIVDKFNNGVEELLQDKLKEIQE